VFTPKQIDEAEFRLRTRRPTARSLATATRINSSARSESARHKLLDRSAPSATSWRRQHALIDEGYHAAPPELLRQHRCSRTPDHRPTTTIVYRPFFHAFLFSAALFPGRILSLKVLKIHKRLTLPCALRVFTTCTPPAGLRVF